MKNSSWWKRQAIKMGEKSKRLHTLALLYTSVHVTLLLNLPPPPPLPTLHASQATNQPDFDNVIHQPAFFNASLFPSNYLQSFKRNPRQSLFVTFGARSCPWWLSNICNLGQMQIGMNFQDDTSFTLARAWMSVVTQANISLLIGEAEWKYQ